MNTNLEPISEILRVHLDSFDRHVQMHMNFLRVQTSIIELSRGFFRAEGELNSGNTGRISQLRSIVLTHFSPILNDLNTSNKTNRGRRRRGKEEDIGG